jgi:hypothetical protein
LAGGCMVASADLCNEKYCWVVVGFFWEKITTGWWLISQTRDEKHFDIYHLLGARTTFHEHRARAVGRRSGKVFREHRPCTVAFICYGYGAGHSGWRGDRFQPPLTTEYSMYY